MRRLIATALTCLSFTLPAQAGDQVTNFTLDNGMEVVVIEDHRAPVVVHMVWYRAGAADELPGASGVAHFLEHLTFKETENLASGELSATVARNGGSDNAFTSWDYTAYFQRIAADRLGLVMGMEADRMANLRLSEDDILTERDVIIEERNQRVENDPSALFREQRLAALYMNHRYGVPIIGWQHEMSTLDLEDAQRFYETHYAPNNAVLVVAGDVTPDEVRGLAEKHYGVIPANPDLPERIRPQEPRQMAERRLHMTDPRVAQPYVMRTYLAPERDPGDQEKAAALTLLAEILGGGVTSLLSQKLSFDSQIAVQSAAWYSGASVDDGSLTMIVVPSQGVSLKEGEAAMDQVVADLLRDGVDEDQLSRIKKQLHAAQIYAQDDVSAIANRYGRALSVGLTVEDVEAWPEILAATTGEDIIDAAREVFQDDSSVTGWLSAGEISQ